MSAKYTAGRQGFGEGSLSWVRDRIVAQLVSREYLFNPAHQDARALEGLVGEPVEVTGRAMEGGWARCAALQFRQVKGEAPVAVVIRRAGDQKGSTLIVYLDGVEGFPMKPNGGDIRVDVPAQGLFRV